MYSKLFVDVSVTSSFLKKMTTGTSNLLLIKFIILEVTANYGDLDLVEKFLSEVELIEK